MPLGLLNSAAWLHQRSFEFVSLAMAVKRALGKLLLALVAATWLPPQAVICCASSESESCFAACCWVSCFLQATLAGWHGHRKPVSEHRDLDIARWLVQSKDFLVNLCSGLGSVATTFQAGVGPLLWCQHTNLAAGADAVFSTFRSAAAARHK